MGGLVKTLFGGSSNKSTSENQAYGQLLPLLSGNIGQGNSAMSTLGSILGIGDPAAGKAALGNFMDATGFQTMLDAGSKAITGNAASRGLLNAGSTGKALIGYGQDLAKTKTMDLLGALTGLGNYGLQSAGAIAGAGGKSTASGSSSQGIFNSLFPGGLSDRRVKRNIVKVGQFETDGLGIYDYEYIFAPGITYRGVMADEVARLRPEALGPEYHGYMTVDYSKIAGISNGPYMLTEVPAHG